MTDELSKEARALLDEVRGSEDPAAHDKARLKRSIAAAIGGGAIATAGASSASALTGAANVGAAAGLTATGTAGAIKLFATLAVCGTLVGVGIGHVRYATQTNDAPAPTRVSSAPQLRNTETTSRIHPHTETQPSAIPEAVPTTTFVEPAAVLPPNEREREHAARPPTQAAPPQAYANEPTSPAVIQSAEPVSTLRDEIRLLADAREALGRGSSADALRSLEQHATRFPNGALREEREAAKVSALCLAENVERAREVAESFLFAYPNSPHAQRVRASCVFP